MLFFITRWAGLTKETVIVKYITTPEVPFITSSLCAIFNHPTSPYDVQHIIILEKQTYTPFLDN